MLEQLLKLVREHAGDAIINNPEIPNQHNNAAIQEVSDQIFQGLKGQANSGNLQDLVTMFRNGNVNGNSPVVTNLITAVAGTFTNKFGVSQQSATNIAGDLLPSIL